MEPLSPFSIAQDIAHQFSNIDLVELVVLGGSVATGKATSNSDIDLYIYSKEPIPLEARACLIQSRSSSIQLDNTFWKGNPYNLSEICSKSLGENLKLKIFLSPNSSQNHQQPRKLHQLCIPLRISFSKFRCWQRLEHSLNRKACLI